MANPSSPSSRPSSIWARRLDIFYVLFLCSIIGIAFALDFVPLYPAQFPSWTRAFYNWFRANYNDPLYAIDPPFFRFYVVIELLYSVPTCVWCIRGLLLGRHFLPFAVAWDARSRAKNGAEDDRMTPVYLLVFATHMLSSTLVCFVEVLGTADWPKEVINKNVPGYVGFFLIAAGMWVDMFLRVRSGVLEKAKMS